MKEARVWLAMIVALAAAVGAMMLSGRILREKIPPYPEIFLSTLIACAVYIAVARFFNPRS